MGMILFSLVLPVYKVESYIEKSVLSCLVQEDINPSEYEIILVDDETPDHSIEIAMNLVKKYSFCQVKVVHRINGGLSAARNTGLQSANGKYIWFIDSDDWIAPNSLCLLKQKLKEIGDVDILSFKHYVCKANGEISLPDKGNDQWMTGFEYLSKNTFLSACERLYRKEFIIDNQLLFAEGYVWEDAQFNIRALAICSSHYYFHTYLYFYLRRESSITTAGISEKMEMSRFYLIDSISEFFLCYPLTSYQKIIINRILAGHLLAAIVGISELPKDLSERYKEKFCSNKKYYLSLLSNSEDIKYYLISILLKISFPFISRLLAIKMKKVIKNNG